MRRALRWRDFRAGLALAASLMVPLCAFAAEPPGAALPKTGNGADRWQTLGRDNSGCDGRIDVVAAAADGTVFVGGPFLNCGGVATRRIARFHPVTETWSALGDGPLQGVSGTHPQGFGVEVLVVDGDTLYVGGTFQSAGGHPANRIARYSISTGRWSSLGTGSRNGVTGSGDYGGRLLAIAVDGAQVYVGGQFEQAGGVAANGVARFDTGRGTWHDLGTGFAGTVYSIVPTGNGDVFLSGEDFTLGGGPVLNAIARYSRGSDSFAPLGPGAGNGLTGPVNPFAAALVLVGSDLYVGGQFTAAGGVAANNIARYDIAGDAWFALPGVANGTSAVVYDLVRIGASLYAGGEFTTAGGVNAAYAARYDLGGGGWSALSTAPLGIDMRVLDFATAGSLLYAVGDMTVAGGFGVRSVARYETVDGLWAPLGTQTDGIGGPVPYAIAVSGNDVIVGGSFSEAGGVTAANIARFDRTTGLWSALGSGLNGSADALAIVDNRLFVGGTFSIAGGVPAASIAEYNLASGTWSAVSGGTNGVVYALVVDGNALYVGGNFGLAGAINASSVARYDLDSGTWSALPGGGTNGPVYAIALHGSDVIASGTFTTAGGLPANNIARQGASGWSALGSGPSNGLNGNGASLAIVGDHVFVGGTFSQAGGLAANRVARYDLIGGNWSVLGVGPANGTNAAVRRLVSDGTRVFVGGDFFFANGASVLRIARYEPATNAWSPLNTGPDNGVSDGVYALTASASTLFVGGAFLQAGGRAARRLATFDARAEVSTTLATSSSALVVGSAATLTASVAAPSFPGTPGTVAFLDGGDTIEACAAVPLTGSGNVRTAACTTSVLGIGSRQLFAIFAGDVSNARDTSLALPIDVAPPAITLAPATLPDATYGAPYAQTLVASAPSGAQPPFTYVVADGALPPGFALDAVSGELAGTTTVKGTYALSLVAHDASPPDLSGPFIARSEATLVVRGLPTTTTVVGDPNPLYVNNPVALTANVTGDAPTGSVDFFNDGGAIAGCAAVPLVGSGNTRSATCTTSALLVGDRSLTATYSGDAINDTSTSPAHTQTVQPPVLALTPTTLPGGFMGAPYDQLLVPSGIGVVGTLLVVNRGCPSGICGYEKFPGVFLSEGGNGRLSGSPLQVGRFAFGIGVLNDSPTGRYERQFDYSVDISAQPTTTTIVSIVPSPATQGEPYTVDVSVAGMAGSPSGVVSVGDGAGGSCFVNLSGGAGSCQLATGSVGQRTVSAAYGGFLPHAPSVGSTTLQVNPSSNASPSRISVGARVGVRGQTLSLPVGFRGDGTTVGFTAQVNFDKDRLQFVSAQPIGDVLCNRLGSPLDDRIRVQAPGTPTGQPLSPNVDTRYCELTFRVADTAPGGVYPLGIVTSTCEDGSGIQRVCTTTNGAVSVSAVETSVPNLSLLAISGYAAQASASRSVRVTNRGDTALSLDCTVFGPSAFALEAGDLLSIGPQLDALVVVGCTLPPLGTTLTGQVVCTTSDAARPTLQYGLACQRVPDGTPLPGDQIFDDGLKQGDQLGTSTGVSQTGGVMAVGAPFAGADAEGRVLIYEGRFRPGFLIPLDAGAAKRVHDAAAPRAVAMLAPPRTQAKGAAGIGDKFGQAVAVSRDGTRVAVGSPVGGASGAGVVLVYTKPPGGWQEANLADPAATIAAPFLPGSNVAEFGASLAFFPDGDLAIGAPGTASGVGGVGAAFVYDAGGGASYARTETLTSTNPQGQGRFGTSLDVSTDGSGAGQLVVGAPQEGLLGQQSGRAYVYPLANGAVGLPQALQSAQPAMGDKWGSAVAVRDGTVVIGAIGDDTSAGVDSGSATVFRARADGSGIDALTLLLPEAGTAQGAGAAVATNGDVILLGAPLATVGGRIGQGRVFVYDIDAAYAATESPTQTLENNDGRAGDAFGRALAVSALNVLAGVPLDDRELDASTALDDVGRADPFVLDRILRTGFE